jgi:hypothetical protein
MPSPRPTVRSHAAVVALLGAIIVATTGVAIARNAVVPAAPTGVAGAGAVQTSLSGAAVGGDPDLGVDLRREHLIARPAAAPAGTEWIGRSTVDTPAPAARAESKGGGGSGTSGSATLTGRNKVWIPSLGIRRSVSFFSCSSSAYPGNRVYRWGCAGGNNVYLFGHAHSVFKPLHDAYVRGRLKKGMKVLYADGKGRVSTYKVIWWRVVAPDKGGFAYAAQSRPSMTLQTCVGKRSQYRLVVRLVKV